jgi:hypothetical protein
MTSRVEIREYGKKLLTVSGHDEDSVSNLKTN